MVRVVPARAVMKIVLCCVVWCVSLGAREHETRKRGKSTTTPPWRALSEHKAVEWRGARFECEVRVESERRPSPRPRARDRERESRCSPSGSAAQASCGLVSECAREARPRLAQHATRGERTRDSTAYRHSTGSQVRNAGADLDRHGDGAGWSRISARGKHVL